MTTPSEGTLPLTPPLPAVVKLLSHLSQVEQSVTNLSSHLRQLDTAISLEDVSSGNKQMAHSCHELAALALRVLNGSPSLSAQGFIVEVQQLSHEIARAGKAVNQTVKKALDGDNKRREMKPKSQKSQPIVENIIKEKTIPKSAVVKVNKELLTSMATGQLTCSPEHKVNRREPSLLMKNQQKDINMYGSSIVDDDSTLI